ncbi:MAG: phosphate/phosphite/phosphonate ABC transporter substrate-binding protein [Gallionella sp.]|jgi:phosphonate transport system substrate-binding protein|nr:phosphate/phosphite/phosphonate ABC transporter substrate-binding protein [Gallionella sp.]MCK9352878.1 phosphate/phosphite/phosphonate ABC transporter substrate-binding protein [Gallionella sp.]
MRNFLSLLGMFLLLCGCGEQQEYQPGFVAQQANPEKNYSFAIHPLHNPEMLLERYGPIVDYINRHIEGAHFTLEASRNYEEFEKKLYAGQLDFALPNPYQTVNSLKHGYHVFGKMGDDHNFTGIWLVRRDSGIRKVSDLKGKKVSYPAKTALAATMMPQYYLHTHGIDVNKDVENLYVGSQESSIMNVYLGQVAAGATWPIPWMLFQQQQPEKAAQLEKIWETEPLINNGLVARNDMPPELVERVAVLLSTLHENEEGRALLARLPISRFERANDASYDVVRSFLDAFSRKVRPLEPQ